MMELSAEQLSQKTQEFRQRLATKKDDLDSLLPEAFAVVREAARRHLNMRHFDSQLVHLLAVKSLPTICQAVSGII